MNHKSFSLWISSLSPIEQEEWFSLTRKTMSTLKDEVNTDKILKVAIPLYCSELEIKTTNLADTLIVEIFKNFIVALIIESGIKEGIYKSTETFLSKENSVTLTPKGLEKAELMLKEIAEQNIKF